MEDTFYLNGNDIFQAIFEQFKPWAHFITKDGSFYFHPEYDFNNKIKLADLIADMRSATQNIVHLYAERVKKREEYNKKLGNLSSEEFFHKASSDGLGRLLMDEFQVDSDGIVINAKTDFYDVQIHTSRQGGLAFLLKRGKAVRYASINDDLEKSGNVDDHSFSHLWTEARTLLDVDKRLGILRDALKDNHTSGPLLADFMREEREYSYWAGRHRRDPGRMFHDSRTEIVKPKEESAAEPKEQPHRGFFQRLFRLF